MSEDGSEHPEERLADALAAYDDRLAGGQETPTDELQEAIDPELLPEWNRLAAFLTLVEQAWPRTGEDPDGRTEPAPTGSASDADSTDAAIAGQFGRFRILRTLGSGGFGIVFLAWDPALRRQVALKVPQPEAMVTPEARKRFLREAHAAAGLDHPNIVPVYETGTVGTVGYIAAAYCPGPTLAIWLSRQSRPVPAVDAARLITTLARAVDHAHERGVLHRDLKPSNILLQRSPDTTEPSREQDDVLTEFQPRITDFSLAWLADGTGPRTQSGVPIGSPPYMAPEQAEGKVKAIGPPADVYGLGCILYELLVGHPPFRGESQLDTLRQVISDAPIPLRRTRKDIPAELEAIVLKCLEKVPARRYPTPRELADDLDRFLAGDPTQARPPSRWQRIRRKAGRHPAAVIVSAVVVVSTVAILVGSRWYESRLESAHRLFQQKDDQAQAHEVESQRHRQYDRDIRQADQLIRALRSPLAHEILMRYRPQPGEQDLRDFTWHLLFRRCHTERLTLRGHRDEVYHVEFSPRGDLLASASKDGTVQIWDTKSWQQVRKFTASETEVNVAAFSPDGKTLATADDEGKLKLWEVATGHLEREILAHNGDAVIARFTPDGKTIITAGRTDGFAEFWDRTTGAWLDEIKGAGLILSPDGNTLATLGTRDEVGFYNSSTRAHIGSLPVTPGIVGGAFSHDGTKLVTAYEGDRLVRLWEISSRRLLREFRGHTEGVLAVTFSPDDRTLVSTGGDGTIRLWDVGTGMQRGVHMGHDGRIWTLALSREGPMIASASRDGTVKIWDSETPEGLPKLPLSRPMCFRFVEDGRALITVDRGRPWFIARWDADTGSFLKRTPLDLPDSDHWSSLSHDGHMLATVDGEGTLTLWNTATGRQQGRLELNFEHLVPQFSPDDHHLLLLCQGGKSWLLWDLAKRRLVPLAWAKPGLAGFTPSGKVIITDHDRNLLWWDHSTGQSRTASLQRPGHMWGATVSPDGLTLASRDPDTQKIHVWSMETLELKLELQGHPRRTDSLTISPDGKTLASSGVDRTVKLWDMATGAELLAIEGFPGIVSDLQFSPDGRALAMLSLATEGRWELYLWRTSKDELESAVLPVRHLKSSH